MNIRIKKWIIEGFAFPVFIFVLSSCGGCSTMLTTELRNPAEINSKIYTGVTPEQVHTVLGEPLVGSSGLSVEVYRHHSDNYLQTQDHITIYELGYVFSLVTYDGNELVKDIATSFWTNDSHYGHVFSLSAGKYSLVSIPGYMPETLLGPPISWKELVDMTPSEKKCTLVMLMGECPMPIVSLDKTKIVNLHPAGVYCDPDLEQSERRKHDFYGTYIKRKIEPGIHQIKVKRFTLGSRNFETAFECKCGETVYAEFKAQSYLYKDWWHGRQLEGDILIHKTPPQSIIEMDTLRPILWYRDTWYGPPDPHTNDN